MKRLIGWLMVRYIEGLIFTRNARALRVHSREMSNCLEAALTKFYAEGGWVIVGRSVSHPLLPHAVHAKHLPQLEVTSFVPGKLRVHGWRAFLRAPAFPGTWVEGVWGDGAHDE